MDYTSETISKESKRPRSCDANEHPSLAQNTEDYRRGDFILWKLDVPKQRRRGAKRMHSHADADVRYLLVRKGFLVENLVDTNFHPVISLRNSGEEGDLKREGKKSLRIAV